MNVLVAVQHRCLRLPDGTVWTQTMFPYAFWRRYLEVFDGVRVLARVQEVEEAPAGWVRFDGDGVSVCPVAHYVGPWQYLRQAGRVERMARAAIDPRDAVILRIPAHRITAGVEHALRAGGHPYAVEVVADPHALFAPRCIDHPLRPLLRWLLTRQQRRLCAGAAAALYVTRASLQRRYPCPGISVGISDVELPDDALVVAPRTPRRDGAILLGIGTMQQVYKGFDVLLDAVARGVRQGADLRVVLIGDGRYRPALARQAARQGIGDRVRFTGELPLGEAVRRQLDQADLFVLPSRSEGLPRALIEAMARALPCLGSAVGGIPELLAPDDLFPAGDATALARQIRAVVDDPRRQAAMSARNLAHARTYRDDLLRGPRRDFYAQVRETTTRWLAREADGLTV